MTPLKFEGFNCIYKGAPGVEDLPAKREDGTVTSRWQPTYEELQTLCGGGSVELVIAGGQPPLTMSVV